MKVPNSYLLSGSMMVWLLSTGEGRWKFVAKSSLASKWHSIWMYCLRVEGGSMAPSGAPSRRSRLYDINLGKCGSCSHLTMGPRGTKASCSASTDAHDMSKEVAT